ncbi:MAG: transglutaminase family protein [Verrucomicrobiales bacterium]
MRFRIAIALLVCGLDCGVSAEDTDAPGVLVEQLDHDFFMVRQRAMVNLLELGEAAVDELEAVGEGASAEQRFRVRELLGEIYRRRLERGFGEIGRCPDQELDVEQGMILIAQILDPKVVPQTITDQLDEMAESVRRSLGDGVDPKSLGGAEAIQAITEVLRDQYQLQGDEEAYDDPDNSSIHRVLEQGDGLPILLSEIAVAVGKRLGVPLVGLGVPGRYMFMYDGSRAPAGESEKDIIVDAFGGWEVKQEDDLIPGWLHPLGGELTPSPPRETLSRMLRNMGSDFHSLGSAHQCELLRRYEALVDGVATVRAR